MERHQSGRIAKSSTTCRFIKLDSLVHLSWETIDQKALPAFVDSLSPSSAYVMVIEVMHRTYGLHGILQKLDSDLHRDDNAFFDVFLNHGAVLRAVDKPSERTS